MTEQNTSVEAPKRPQFLTVLCILTFIGSGIGVVSSIMGYFAAKAAGALAQGFADMGNQMTDGKGTEAMNAAMESANASIKWAAVVAIIGVIAALVCLVGAIMMWKQKKTGFYIYVLGEIAPVIAGAALMGGSYFGGMAIAMSLVFPVAFIIMYGLNLKHMS